MPVKIIQGEQRILWGALLIIIGLLIGLIILFTDEFEAQISVGITALVFIIMGLGVILYKPTIDTFKEEVIKR